MQSWYYSNKGERRGPVGFEELRALALRGELDRTRDLVWTEPMMDWQAAGSIPGLFDVGPAINAPAATSPRPPGQNLEIQNPYAPPASPLNPISPPPMADAPVEIAHGSRQLDLSATFLRAFTLTKRSFWRIFMIGLIFILVTSGLETILKEVDKVNLGGFGPVPEQWLEYIGNISSYRNFVCFLVSWVAGTYMTLGLNRVALNAASGDPMDVGMLFGQGDKIWRNLVAEVLYWIIVLTGLALLIIPGLFLAMRLLLYSEAIVDRNLGPVDALKYSFSLTKNNALGLWGYAVMSILVFLAGVLALVVGVGFALPVITIALTVAYRFFQYGNAALHDIPGTRTPILRGHHGQ